MGMLCWRLTYQMLQIITQVYEILFTVIHGFYFLVGKRILTAVIRVDT